MRPYPSLQSYTLCRATSTERAVRLIHYALDSRFNHDTPNVVHMTIKPQDYIEEDDAKGGKGSFGAGGDGTGRSPGCRCLVM